MISSGERRLRLVLVISILASFVALLDGSVVNVALPAIKHELGGGLALQQWVVDAYLLTLGSLILIAGSLSDLFGRLRMMGWGLGGFALASVLCAVAPTGTFLVVVRAMQGVAGALLVPSSLALIIAMFPAEVQGKAIGRWTAWTGVAFIVGPLVGGFLVDAFSWRWIFAINVLPVAVTLALMRLLKKTPPPAARPAVDVRGAALCALGLGATVFSLIEQGHYGWASPFIYIPLTVGVLAFGGFLLLESRTKAPMLPLGLFTVRNFGVGNASTAAIYAGLSVATFLVTVYVQQIGGYTAIQAGLALLPVTLFMFVLSPRFGALSGRYGPRLFMTVGPLIAAAGFLLMLRVHAPIVYITQLLPGTLLFGLGLAATVAPLTTAILSSIEGTRAGIASATNNAVARMAGLVAIAMIGIVTGTTLTTASFHRGTIAMAALLAVGAVISGIGIQNPHSDPK
jgi:EmrB/QacA subfamily drug resistance transporter